MSDLKKPCQGVGCTAWTTLACGRCMRSLCKLDGAVNLATMTHADGSACVPAAASGEPVPSVDDAIRAALAGVDGPTALAALRRAMHEQPCGHETFRELERGGPCEIYRCTRTYHGDRESDRRYCTHELVRTTTYEAEFGR